MKTTEVRRLGTDGQTTFILNLLMDSLRQYSKLFNKTNLIVI